MASLKGNVILNGINTFMGILYPVITFPYASRILLPEGIGAVNFLNSIISYIVLFTSLGIPMYALREVAKYRDNIQVRNKVTIEILILSFLLCLVGYLAVFLLATFVTKIENQSALFYILSLSIVFTSLGVQWFYQGIEDFKFITIRGIAVRTLAAASLFIFVKTPNDLLIYGLIFVGSTVGNNIWNFLNLRKHIRFSIINWQELQIFHHIVPTLKLFVFNLIISIYINLNTMMLGFMQDDTAVGYYTAGNKISHIALTLVASLGIVMLPRCTNLIKNGQFKEFSEVSSKAMRLVIGTSLPIFLGLAMLASPIIQIFCGESFVNAIPVLVWTAPIVIIVGISNVIGIQILYPLGKENTVIYSTICGAILNLILNIWLIPKYSYIGTAIGTLLAELTVTIYQIIIGRNIIPFKFRWSTISNYIYGSFGVALCLLVNINLFHHGILLLIVGVVSSVITYGATLYFLKDELFIDLIKFTHFRKSKLSN